MWAIQLFFFKYLFRETFGSNNNSSNGFQPFSNSDNNSSSFDPNDDVENKADTSLLAKLVSSGLKWVDENNVTVTDQRKDKSNPLFGQVLSFQELNLKHEIVKALQDMKFVRPSAIQSKALPILLSEPPNHMIAQSQSGTGKTAAFVLATLSRINVDERYDFFYFS